jgi:hypothetical protein
MKPTVCAIATRPELPQARALAWSLRTHDPAGELLVLLLDDRRCEVDPAREPFVLVRPSSLDLARFELLAGMHAAPELKLVVEPAFLRYALDRTGGPLIYLGIDALVYAPLGRIASLAVEHRLVLVPRLQAPVPRDHVRLTDAEIAKLGVFDQGCLALAPSDPIDAFLRGWSDRLEHDPAFEIPLVTGRFLDFAPGFLEEARILLDPGIGVSRLNLHERQITHYGASFAANGQELVIARCEGLDGAEAPHPNPYGGPQDGGPPSAEDRVRTPEAGREAMQRTLLLAHPGLAKLVEQRALLLEGCRTDATDDSKYGYERLADGTPLSRRLRRAVRDGELYGGLGGSPFDAAGTNELLKWLNAPAQRGAAAGVTRYWFEIYRERVDLQMIHPDLDGPGGPGLVRWAVDHGRRDFATPDALLPLGIG